MQSTRESNRQKRPNKRRHLRKKSLSPSDLRDVKTENSKRSHSEGSSKTNKHRKSNIRRTLTHPFSGDLSDVTNMIGISNSDVTDNAIVFNSDVVNESIEVFNSAVRKEVIDVFNMNVKVPAESDESNLPPTSSDRDTEDDSRIRGLEARRTRWDSGSEMDSLVSTVVRRASARRRRTSNYPEWSLENEASEAESGRMRPEDYRLVFLSSDSSCREDNEDSSSTASSAAPPAPDDCDWDYFEPGAPHPPTRHVVPCPRTCSCGAEPRIVAVPVPVPVPVPAALWPALLAFPQNPPTPHWHTYPGFPPLDAAALARLTSAAAAAVSAVTTAHSFPKTINTTVNTDNAIPPQLIDNDKNVDKNVIERLVAREVSDEIKVIAEADSTNSAEAMPDHLEAEKGFDSDDSSDSESGVARGSYDVTSGAPDEPATSDSDSDDSGGGGGQFSRVFVVNPADSSSEGNDQADSSGIDCDHDDEDDKKEDSLENIPPPILDNIANYAENVSPNDEGSVVLLESANISDNDQVEVNYEAPGNNSSVVMKYCSENMLQSETCENYNSFNTTYTLETQSDLSDSLDAEELNHTEDLEKLYRDSLDNSTVSNCDAKVKVTVALPNETQSYIKLVPATTRLSTSPEPQQLNSHTETEKIDLFKGIERTLSALLKKELMVEEKLHGEQVSAGDEGPWGEEGQCAGAGASPELVSRPRANDADVPARFTSRVMITHDLVSVVTTDTTRLMRDVTVHHTNSSGTSPPDEGSAPQPSVTVVSNADTLSAVLCLEEGLADDDSWVEDVSHDEGDQTTTDSDSGDEAGISTRGQEFQYCKRSLDFTLHTIVEESCEESEPEQTKKKPRPISATELEKYFCFGLGDGGNTRDDEDAVSDTYSVCSEGAESIVENEQPERIGDNEELVSSRLKNYFLSGIMGFSQDRRDSDESGSVGSDSEGKQSPEQRRKRLVRARGAPRSHSSSLDNLLTGEEPSQDPQEISDGSSTETEDRHDSSERLDVQNETKRKKQTKKARVSPADERRLSTEFAEETRDDTRSVSEGEEGRTTPRPEFPLLGSELSESKKQTSRDSGFVGSCDDLLRNGDSSSEYARSHEPKTELEEITEEIRQDVEEKVEKPTYRPPPSPLSRKDSFNNWSSDEETNLMMTKMRQFFKQMINSSNGRTSTPASVSSASESPRPPKPPQLLYFESELTRLMKTVPGIRDEEVREIVEYLSSEDTWSDSYDSSDYAGSDLEGTAANRSALRKQISESCREIIDEFDKGQGESGSLERDAAGAYRRLAATLGRAGEGSPPLFGKVMRHIGGRLVALMHEVSAGASPSTDEDSASEPGALARSRSHDILEAAASRGSVASDCERFSWRGSFESALLAADSRGTLGGVSSESRRSPAGVELAAQRSHSRSCGAIGGSEDRLWRGRRRASAPDAESEEEQRSGSLPRLPSVNNSTPAPGGGPVKSARYRAPGFRTATRAASAPGLHVPRRRRPMPVQQVQTPAAPASSPSLQGEFFI